MESRKPKWNILRRSLQGEVVLPGEAGYDLALQLQDVQFDVIRPQAVVYCENRDDVRTSLHFAQDERLRVAVRSGGHSTAGYSTTTGMVLDVSRLNSISVGDRFVTMGPGTQAVDAANVLAPHGLATPNGFCPTVAAGGFFTGGGIGLLTRSLGVGSDRLRSAEVVLASGQVVRCSEQEEPGLFWALRGGGGGNFGVVTSYEIDPVHLPQVVNFSLTWSWDSAASVVSAWQQWAPTRPHILTSWMGLFLPDAAPGTVADVEVSGMWQGSPADLDPHLAELTGMVTNPPLATDVQELPYQTAMMRWWFCGDKTVGQCHRTGYHGGVLPRTTYQTLRGRMFSNPMPGSGVEEFLTAFDANRRAGQTRVSTFAGLGGEDNQFSRSETAYVHRTSQFLADYGVTLTNPAPTEEERSAARHWATNGFDTIDPYSNGESYQNYSDPELRNWQQSYYAENYKRLTRVKRHYDPDDFFRRLSFPAGILASIRHDLDRTLRLTCGNA